MRRPGKRTEQIDLVPAAADVPVATEKKIKYAHTVCMRVQVDPHISRRPVYRLVSDVADAINSVPHDAAVRKVHGFCDRINN